MLPVTTGSEKTHQQTHINQKSVTLQLQKMMDGCSYDQPGRKRQAERGRSVESGNRDYPQKQQLMSLVALLNNSIAKTLEGAK